MIRCDHTPQNRQRMKPRSSAMQYSYYSSVSKLILQRSTCMHVDMAAHLLMVSIVSPTNSRAASSTNGTVRAEATCLKCPHVPRVGLRFNCAMYAKQTAAVKRISTSVAALIACFRPLSPFNLACVFCKSLSILSRLRSYPANLYSMTVRLHSFCEASQVLGGSNEPTQASQLE